MKVFHIHKKDVVVAIAILYILLFVYTASSKLMHLGVFELRLERMPYIAPYAEVLSWGVPFVELVIVGLLLVPKFRVLGLYASLALLALFTIYITVVLQFSDSIPCSCGGIISALGWKDHILLNTIFILFALLGILWSQKKHSLNVHQNTT